MLSLKSTPQTIPPSTIVPLGVAAPSGFHWSLIENNDFTQMTSRPAGWAQLDGCCITFDSTNGLTIRANNVTDPADVRIGICRDPNGNGDCYDGNSTGLRFGYWEYSMKEPTTAGGAADGYHSDLWFRPARDFASGVEIDAAEKQYGNNNSNIELHHLAYPADEVYDEILYPNNSTDLSAAFHTYGQWWRDDGTTAGYEQGFFDGSPISGGNSMNVHSAAAWDQGLTELITLDPCYPNAFMGGTACNGNASTNNPWFIKYLRIWQLMPD